MKICLISFGPIESKSNGYHLRSYFIAKSLAEANHDVLIMEFPEEKLSDSMKSEERMKFVHLRGNENISLNLVSRISSVLTFDLLHVIRFQLYSLIELIRFRYYIRESDLVFVEGALIPFAIILSKVFKKKVVVDTHCINKLLAVHFKDRSCLIYFTRKILWDLLERFATRLSDAVLVVSKKERDFVLNEYKIPESKIFIVPNVIEIKQRNYPKEELIDLKKKWNLENKIIITFVGNLQSVQNRDAVEYIINDLAPFFWKERKDVVFLIVGKGEKDFKCTLPNVVFTGFVKELSPFLEISDICIAPLRVGAGTKTKILEYMAYGKPVVSTPIGVEGIKLSGTELSVVVAKTEAFPEKLMNTIENLGRIQNAKPQRIVEKLYSKQSMRQNLNELLKVMRP